MVVHVCLCVWGGEEGSSDSDRNVSVCDNLKTTHKCWKNSESIIKIIAKWQCPA